MLHVSFLAKLKNNDKLIFSRAKHRHCINFDINTTVGFQYYLLYSRTENTHIYTIKVEERKEKFGYSSSSSLEEQGHHEHVPFVKSEAEKNFVRKLNTRLLPLAMLIIQHK